MEKKKKIEKNKKVNKVSYRTSEQDEMVKFVIVILVVLLSVGAIYLITRAFVTKDLFVEDSKNNSEAAQQGSVNYEVAIMGQLLNRPYKQYYAVIYDSEGDYNFDMYTLVSDYTKQKDHKHIYTIDLANELNKSYYDKENVNKKATKVSEMKVGDITLVKVKNGKIEKYIVDYAKMQKELGIEEK